MAEFDSVKIDVIISLRCQDWRPYDIPDAAHSPLWENPSVTCNVSHAAPYAHFKDKDELIEAIKKSVTEQLMSELEDAVHSASDSKSAIVRMGKRYVSFFRSNPDYYKFLFGRQNIIAHLKIDEKTDEDYPPFVLLKNTYLSYLKEYGLKKNKKEQEIELLKTWASAHGLAAIACMSGVIPSFDWDEMLEGDDLLK